MLGLFRRFLDTWAARAFFVVLIGSFGLWGVADVIRNVGGNDGVTVARVGDAKIGVTELQDAARRMLAQVIRQNGGKITPTPEIRREVAQQALQQLVVSAAFAGEADRLRVEVPDAALRDAVRQMPAFLSASGQFDRAKFEQILGANNLNEDRFLALMRRELAQRQIAEAIRAGGSSPDVLNRLVFEFQGETRVADLVSLPFAGAAQPPAPTAEQIERYYDDNTAEYATPELRRIKAVILSPERLAQDITVSDEDARGYYDIHKAEFEKPDTRSVQVIIAPDEAAGRKLATAWSAGADWDAMQKQAAAATASAVELDNTTQAAFPSPDLAKAVFAAAPNAVTGPLKIDDGYPVFRVVAAVDGTHRSFEDARAEVKQRVALERAADQVYDRANKLQDALAGGAKLDELPSDLGVAAVTGTLDAQGDTQDGAPAPIPGSPELKTALVAKAFQMAAGDPATLEDAGGGSFYAVDVETVTPPANRKLDEVKARVVDDWTRDQRRHEQDVVAARLLTAVKGGGSLKDAAELAGLPMRQSPPIGRGAPPAGVPAELTQPLFTLKPNQPTMVETPEGFVVAVLVSINQPDPAAASGAIEQIRLRLAGGMSDDIETTFAGALRDREKVTVNGTLFESALQP